MAKYISSPFGNKSNSDRSSPDKTQVALTYDILSEGEIEGLSDGLASVFLNDVPIIDKIANNIIKIRRTTTNTTANNTTISSSVFGDIRTLTHNNLSGLSLGSRGIVLEKAHSTTAVASATAGTTTVTTSSAFFTSEAIRSLRSRFNSSGMTGYIRIEGAGPNGTTLVTTASFVSTTQIRITDSIATTVSNTNLHIDLVTNIASLSGNNAVLATAPGVSLTGTDIVISGANIGDTKLKSLYNVDNLQFGIRTGVQTQTPLILDSDFGQSSVISSPNIEMLQNNLRANVGTSGNLHSSYNNELDEPSQAEGTAADTLLTSSFLGVTNPAEVDEVHLTFQFPSCHAIKSSSGAKGSSFVELQMFFEYSTDGGSSFTSELAFGASNSNLQTRPAGGGGRNVHFFSRSMSDLPNNGYVKPREAQYSAFSEEFVMNIEQFQPFDAWRIRVRRINDVNFKDGSFQHTNPCTLSTVESIVKDKLSYPHTSYAAVAFNAKDFNSQLPKRTYTLKGLKIQVPTNYRTREETGGAAAYTRNISSGDTESGYQNWDGNFRGDTTSFNASSVNHKKVFCDNPVWVFYDLLTNERYGIGQFIDKSQIDIYELFRIAKYCDEEIPDGEGGVEPRFTCNAYLPKAGEATKVLKQFASIFRGIALWNEGALTLAVDRPKEPVYSFSKANVLGGAFTYEGTGDRVRTNQVKVTWNDPQDNYVQSTEYVEDYESIADTGRIVRAESLAFGCTSRGQAHRLGKWKLLSEQNEKETVSFSTSLNAVGLKPGDIILVQDADKDRSSYSGRISNSGTRSTTVIPLDRTISLPTYDSNFKHELNLIYPSGGAYLQQESAVYGGATYYEGDLILSITSSTAAANAKDDSNNAINVMWSENIRVEKQEVTTSAGNVNSLTVGSAFSAVPDTEVMWILKLYNTDGTEKTGSAKEFRIVSIKEEEKMQLDIVASAYHKNKFAEIERGHAIAPRPTRTVPDPEDVVPSPKNLVINISPEDSSDELSTEDGNITGYKAIISWDYPLNSDGSKFKFCNGFELEHDFLGTSKTILVGSNDQAFSVTGISAGEYLVRIRTKSSIGTVSTFLQRSVEVGEDELLPPSKSRLERLQKGGDVNSTVAIAANGTFSFGNSSYVLTSPDGSFYTNTSSTAATHSQSFVGMGASAEAFLLFDASETTDRLKAVQVHTDSTVSPAINYLKEVGASNNGLTSISGTVTIEKFSNEVTGSSTSFATDFSAGDLIKIEGGSNTTRTTSGAITDSTAVTLSSSNTSIKVGQSITGTGVVVPCHVAAIDGTSLTLSNQQTIGSGVTLTFTQQQQYARVRFVESDTLMFLDEIVQRPFSGAAAKKQSFIPNANLDFILLKIATDGSTAYSISEQYIATTGVQGPAGDDGQSNAIVYAYQRSATALSSNPGAVTVSLTGTTSGTITTGSLANGWSKTIPSGTNPLYVCAATAAGTGSTDTIAANEWSSPVILAESGQDGLNSATVFLYQNNNTGNAPSNLPSGNVTYTFATGSIGSFGTSANGWTITNPGVTNSNNYLWVTQATAAANTATDVIADSEWATIKLLAQKGDDGAAGPRTTVTRLNHTASASSAPTAPTASNTNTFDFSDGNFDNILSGWSHSTPTYASGNSNKYWYIDVTVVESSFGGSQTLSFGSVTQAIGFSGLVTFSNANTISDGTNTKTPIQAGDVNANVTSINGSVIQTGTILANRLKLSGTGAITIGSLSNDLSFVDAAGAASAAPVQSVNGGTGAVTITASGLNISSSHVSGLADGATTSVASILAGNHTGNVNGVAAATVTSGAAAGATANQNTNAAIVATLFSANTAITAGRISLTSGTTTFRANNTSSVANNSIDIDSTSANGGPRIVIADSS